MYIRTYVRTYSYTEFVHMYIHVIIIGDVINYVLLIDQLFITCISVEIRTYVPSCIFMLFILKGLLQVCTEKLIQHDEAC